jgi:hypothetical protein
VHYRGKGSFTGVKRSHRHIKAVVLITTAFVITAAVTGGLLEINVIDGEGLVLRYGDVYEN